MHEFGPVAWAVEPSSGLTLEQGGCVLARDALAVTEIWVGGLKVSGYGAEVSLRASRGRAMREVAA